MNPDAQRKRKANLSLGAGYSHQQVRGYPKILMRMRASLNSLSALTWGTWPRSSSPHNLQSIGKTASKRQARIVCPRNFDSTVGTIPLTEDDIPEAPIASGRDVIRGEATAKIPVQLGVKPANSSILVKEMICYSQTKEERTLTGSALSVHMGKILVAGGGFEPPTFGL